MRRSSLLLMLMPMPYSLSTLKILTLCTASALTCCAGTGSGSDTPAQVDVKILSFNDFHGQLEPPQLAIKAPSTGPTPEVLVPAGGAAYLASAIDVIRSKNPNTAVVSAGDMIGASPLVSGLFLDEPTIDAVNLMHIDFHAVGNHEFDRGEPELLRMQYGGCAKYTRLTPCQIDRSFGGANFGFLAANTLKADGNPLFAATGIKTFTQDGITVKIGFIGVTLKATPTLVTPQAVADLRFQDEADTANAQIAPLLAQGADAIVVVIHEGGKTTVGYDDPLCTGLSGDILPILERLDARVDVVLSGHTHQAYICDYSQVNPAKPFLLTSAGNYGTLLTEVSLTIDPQSHRVTSKKAHNFIVQGEPYTKGNTTVELTYQYPRFTKHPQVAALVAQYVEAAAPLAQRVVGKLSANATRSLTRSGESVLGNLVADAQLAATSPPTQGGAQIAFMNPGGLRADLIPSANGDVTFGQLVSVQPFGNTLVVKTMTGAQIKAVLEQQFNSGVNTAQAPKVLLTSKGFTYQYNLALSPNARVSNLMLDGTPIAETASYRVTMNSFLASGGDNFTVFNQGTNAVNSDQDIDALEAYINTNSPVLLPTTNRISRL